MVRPVVRLRRPLVLLVSVTTERVGIVAAVKLRERTVRAALDADESFGFAVARFDIEEGDLAHWPGERSWIIGPARLTYTRVSGRVTVRIT